ncbi:NAD(+) synthase [Haloarcula sp. S1AR25-5A]|uniref:NH(3)-dependent NAD(+) synthetase n=1 Tax=Haloarcula terrestris TaxID=2950533 RepID=A0AAE4JHM7_9EURY|nr:NAD(+) synthase [Haloarcula terrestris]MDS0222813.1 NAD(+) synthase [Haloarcula terrestris]
MSKATHPHTLKLPREDNGLATSKAATRRIQGILPVFLENKIIEAEANGLVVPLDGSVESTVAAALAVDGIGADYVTGLVMPVQLNDEAPARTAETVASLLDIECHRLQLQPVLTAFQRVVGDTGEPTDDLVAMQNASERFRMACKYYVANTRNELVVGTVPRTDRLLGSVAKYGENGTDLSLFGDLYRTEIAALADALAVPSEILDHSSQPLDHTSATDAAELGIDQTELDSILHFAIDKDCSAPVVADRVGVAQSVVERAIQWCARTRHKRHTPPKPSMDH